jgi:hypothetical protein
MSATDLATPARELPQRLYDLLPAILRQRDEDADGILKKLMNVIEAEVRRAEAATARLYHNWFIETCDAQSIARLAELVDYPLPADARHLQRYRLLGRHPRREVANAISYRRRSGTATLLPELAWDVAGFPARAIEFSRRPDEDAAHLRRVTSAMGSTVTTANDDQLGRLTSQLEQTESAQTVVLLAWRAAVRRIPRAQAIHVPVPRPDRVAASNGSFDEGRRRFAIDPLGREVRLFLRPDPHPLAPVGSGADPAIGLPIPLEPQHFKRAFPSGASDISTEIYGRDLLDRRATDSDSLSSLAIYVRQAGDVPKLHPSHLIKLVNFESQATAADLSTAVARVEPGTVVKRRDILLDPTRGWMLVPSEIDQVLVTYYECAPPGIGAAGSQEVAKRSLGRRRYESAGRSADGNVELIHSEPGKTPLIDALGVKVETKSRIIEITDSGIYGKQFLRHAIEDGHKLVIRAAENARPVIGRPYGEPTHTLHSHSDPHAARYGDTWGFAAHGSGTLILDGLYICRPLLLTGEGHFILRGCTITGPDTAASAVIISSDVSSVQIDHCNIQGITCHGENRQPTQLTIADSVIDSIHALLVHVRLHIVRSTVLKKAFATYLPLAENTLFGDRVEILHRQAGGMRYCYVPSDSKTPRRYACQEPPASGGGSARLEFISRTFGTPGYAMLANDCAEEIRHGADDGGEIGALHDAYDFQRLTDLEAVARAHVPGELTLKIVPVEPPR